jgi:hypothetical protein
MHATLVLALMLLATPADKPPMAMVTRVRTTAGTAPLLEQATQSATVRDLLSRLAATDVIVYIELTPSPAIPLARTKLVTVTETARFLRIGVNFLVPPRDAPALIAHELQHAVEIAEREDVRSDDDIRRLYARIGHRHGTDSYETDAARLVERRTREELRGKN